MWVTGEYFDGFRAAQLAARGRLDAPAQPDPLLRLDSFQRIWEREAPGVRPLIVRARVAQAEAWLFLARTRAGRAVALAGRHAIRFAPVFVGEPDPAMKRSLMRAIARRLKQFRLTHVALDALLPEDAALVRRAFSSAGWAVSERGGNASFRIDVAGRHFEDLWETRSARLHEQVAAGSRHLNVEVADLITPRLWEEVELIGGGDPLLRGLAEDGSVDRTLRLGIARVGEAPVAAQLWTVEDGHAVAHWRGEDGAAHDLHPATQLTASMLRYLINVDHARTIELGSGRDADLADWADDRQVLRRLELFNPLTPSAWAGAVAAKAAGLVRRAPLD